LNHLEFLGYTSEGDVLIDSDTIDVTFSGNWDPPVLEGIDPSNGLAGIPIQLSGSDFHTGLKVYFDSLEATSVVFNETADPAHITVTVPSGLSSGPVEVRVTNSDAQQSNLKTFTVLSGFIRGDANLDGKLDLSDAVKILLVLYSGATTTCSDSLDVDDSGTLDTTDPIRLLEYLFRGAGAPPAPFPDRGLDPTAGDVLTCELGL
jgi:hypothetical protein